MICPSQINTLALAERQEVRRSDNSGAGPAAGHAHTETHTAATATAAGKTKRASHGNNNRYEARTQASAVLTLVFSVGSPVLPALPGACNTILFYVQEAI